jgi:predicted porin
MKKPLILAVAAITLAAGAQAETKFYGKMNVSLQQSDTGPDLSLNSNASRLGVKGSEDLGGSKVIYKAEYQTAIDGTGQEFKQRDAYIGLAYNKMGTVKMGVMDTPLKKSQGKFDLFNDVYDMKRGIAGDERKDNSLNYTSEKLGSVQLSVSYIMKEDATKDDGISASVTFNEGDLYASVAMDSATDTDDTATQRVTVLYNMGDMRFGALVNIVDAGDTAGGAGDETGISINASMKMGKNTAKVQYGMSEQASDPAAADTGMTALTFGVDHKLAKGTKAYAYADIADSDNTDETSFSFGLEHKF